MTGGKNVITTQRVQLTSYFKNCKSSHWYYQDKHLRTAKTLTLSYRHDTQNFKHKEEWNSIKVLSDTPCTLVKLDRVFNFLFSSVI